MNLRDLRAVSPAVSRAPASLRLNPMSPSRLEVENLHLWRGERHVLRGVGFALSSGECLKLTGANGAGKTSLLRTLAGLMYPEQGRVSWGGEDVRRDLRAFQGSLLYLGHEPPLKADLTARENLRYWLGTRRRLSKVLLDASLARVGAEALAERLVRTLSAGQRRRVALAALPLCGVPLWLLDEPATNLDAEGQRLVGSLLGEQLARGGLAVAAVHHGLPADLGAIRQLELAA
jgi:heme exporter protein A